VLVRRDLPQLFQPEPELLRIAAFRQTVFGDQFLRQVAARAFGKQRVFGAKFHAAGEACVRLAVLADAHVASGDAGHRASLVGQHLGRGKARVDFDAERLGLDREPAADVA
jgi:hypothetical protein